MPCCGQVDAWFASLPSLASLLPVRCRGRYPNTVRALQACWSSRNTCLGHPLSLLRLRVGQYLTMRRLSLSSRCEDSNRIICRAERARCRWVRQNRRANLLVVHLPLSFFPIFRSQCHQKYRYRFPSICCRLCNHVSVDVRRVSILFRCHVHVGRFLPREGR